MTSPHEGRGLLSRLPDDPRYWTALADRITADASPRLRALHSAEAWWSLLGRLSPLLATAAAAAVIAALALMPPRAPAAEHDTTAEAFDFTPDDPIAGSVLSADGPPALAALLGLRTGGRDR